MANILFLLQLKQTLTANQSVLKAQVIVKSMYNRNVVNSVMLALKMPLLLLLIKSM